MVLEINVSARRAADQGSRKGLRTFQEAEKEFDDKVSRSKQKRKESEKLPFNSRSPAYLEYLITPTTWLSFVYPYKKQDSFLGRVLPR